VEIFLALASSGGCQERGASSGGGVTARPGTPMSGFLEMPAGVDGGARLPATVAHRVRPLPVLAFIAGTHSLENPPILALHRLRWELDSARLAGAPLVESLGKPRRGRGGRSAESKRRGVRPLACAGGQVFAGGAVTPGK
jgi:hypothetical protein